MTTLDKTAVLAAFEAAYVAAHGTLPEITAKGGWYSVDGNKNVRLADLNTQIDDLNASAVKTAPVHSSIEENEPTKTPFSIIKTNDTGFTAEELWIVKLAETFQDCRLPRGLA